MAEAPGVLEAYQMLHQLFQDSSFNKDELTVVWQTINVEHECHYCVPAHTAVAHMMKVDPALTEALRNGAAMPTEKLQVLQDTTLAMVRNRGRLSEAEIEVFYAAGYGKRQILEIVLGADAKGDEQLCEPHCKNTHRRTISTLYLEKIATDDVVINEGDLPPRVVISRQQRPAEYRRQQPSR